MLQDLDKVGDIVQCVRCGAIAPAGEKLQHTFPCVFNLDVFYQDYSPETEDEDEEEVH